jgi:hypothetical protein
MTKTEVQQAIDTAADARLQGLANMVFENLVTGQTEEQVTREFTRGLKILHQAHEIALKAVDKVEL